MPPYLLQTEENRRLGKRREAEGDVIVSEDFRSVYRIAKDGSRRRIKDKETVKTHVSETRRRLEAQERRQAEGVETLEVADDPAARRRALNSILPMLAIGGSLLHRRPR
jgi:hypothetical protein